MTTAVLFSDQTQLHCRGCRQFSDYTAPPPKNPLNFSKSPRPIVTFYLSIFYWNIHLFDLDFYVIWNAIQSLFFFWLDLFYFGFSLLLSSNCKGILELLSALFFFYYFFSPLTKILKAVSLMQKLHLGDLAAEQAYYI